MPENTTEHGQSRTDPFAEPGHTGYTLVYDAADLVVGPADADSPNRLRRIEGGALVVADGRVVAVGDTADVTREYPAENADTAVDASGKAVTPGFVDPHTHALFAGDRSDEFARKLRGESYQEILAGGGGILKTVRAVRDASTEELAANLTEHLDRMLAFGTTTVEVKSGYGLDTETELRMLDAIDRAAGAHPVDVVPTFMGAHAVPEGTDADDYVDAVVEEQLPAVAEQGVAEFCDVFCDEGAFTAAQSRRVLEAGVERGLTPKIHAEEFARIGGSEVGADVGAASADHLLNATDEDAAALAEAGVTPVLLPGTAFGLGADYADPSLFDEPAIASDFNPNCYARSMGFAATLACVGMGMTPEDALVAATRNAARAVDRDDGLGTLQPGAPGDCLVLDAPSFVHVPYEFGESTVETVVKNGGVVYER